MKRLIAFALVVGAGIAVACGEDDPAPAPQKSSKGTSGTSGSSKNGDDDDSSSTSAVDSFTTAFCAFQERCRRYVFRAVTGDRASCEEQNRGSFAFEASLPGSGYTDTALRACIAKMKDVDCGIGLDTTAECKLAGSLPDGQTCLSFVQCAGGACSQHRDAPTDPYSPCGVCTRLPNIGESCADTQCANGAFADDSASTATEIKCTCVKAPQPGEACTTFCDGFAVCKNNICTIPHEKGAACIDDADCNHTNDLVCANLKCVERTRAAAGAACSDTLPCLGGSCINGFCAARVGQGAVCDPGGSAAPYCKVDLDCDVPDGGTTGTCAKIVNHCN